VRALRVEVVAYLEAIAPEQATAPEIGLAVRARRGRVDECLGTLVASGAVEREEHPGRATYFRITSSASKLVPSRRDGNVATDLGFLLAVLADGEFHTLTEILQLSFRERGCGLTVHSRAAEARRAGHVIENVTTKAGLAGGGFSRAVSSYRLVAHAGSARAAAEAA
jgi:hypothetical protein